MATGIAFPESNLTLGAPTPEDAAAGTVYGLPVLRYRDLFNCWGPTHPPIWISGTSPFR